MIGWTLMIFSLLMIAGVGVISIWDGFRSGYTFRQFFLRFITIFTIYKIYDMTCFDWFLLCKFRFFQYYFPETEPVYNGRKYGYNLKSQLLKLLVIFPAASALAAWICSLFWEQFIMVGLYYFFVAPQTYSIQLILQCFGIFAILTFFLFFCNELGDIITLWNLSVCCCNIWIHIWQRLKFSLSAVIFLSVSERADFRCSSSMRLPLPLLLSKGWIPKARHTRSEYSRMCFSVAWLSFRFHTLKFFGYVDARNPG